MMFLTRPAWAQVEDAASLVGKLYKGTLQVRIIPPKASGHRARSDFGRATVVLEDSGSGTARLIVNGRIKQDGDAGFVAPGQLGDKAWGGESTNFRLGIGPDGQLSGSGTYNGAPTTIDGTYRNNDLRLLVEMEMTAKTQGGFPAGTRFQFLYEVRHFPPRPEREGAPEVAPGGCREVVWRTRLTPNLFGGGMNSVRVPECRR